MDDETAEIELLEQNLNKTRQISQKMTTILSGFDTRLMKLEKAILPLYNSTQILTRRGNNIESALQKMDEIASNQEGIAAEEALILKGPQPGHLDEYQDVLERLNASVAFKSMGDYRDTARLVETGTKKLSQLYTKLVAEGSSGIPPNGPEFELQAFPSNLFSELLPIVNFLRTLPLPPTHPSHPAAPAIQATLKEAQKGYADMRGSWCLKCLEMYGKRIVERAETLDGVVAGRELGKWVDNLLFIVQLEYKLLTELAPLPAQSNIESTFLTLVTPLMNLFTATTSSLSSLIKRSLLKNTFLALSATSNLAVLQTKWDEIIVRRTGKKENELKDSINTIRSSCLRSFPEFIADIRAAALGKGGEFSTGLADFTLSTVQYIERIPELRDAVGPALQSLGDGNWKMGDGVQVGKGAKSGETDEKTLLEHFLHDVVNAAITSLLTLSRTNKRPSFGSIFLLNNISYLRTSLIVSPRIDISALLSKPTQDILNSNFRIAKAGYFDSNFTQMMQALVDDGQKSNAAVKEKFTRFFDLLEENAERHKLARVLQEDAENREAICEEAVKMVVPSLLRFTQKSTGKGFSKNPSKYIKMSNDEVEKIIRNFYADGDVKVVPPAERTANNMLIQAGWSR